MAEQIPATRAPSTIGALVASLAGIELDELLGAAPGTIPEHSLVSRELYLSARTHVQYLATLQRSARCRFNHEIWTIETLDDGPLETLIADTGLQPRGAEISIEGRPFVRELHCRACGHRHSCFHLHDRLPTRICTQCGQELQPSVLELFDRLAVDELPAALRGRPLRERGLVPGDVFALRAAGEVRHYELACEGDALERANRAANPTRRKSDAVSSLILVGLGNIGSQLVGHMARTSRSHGISRVLLADPDVYSAENLAGQEICRADIGRFKVDVCADRMRAIDPELDVVPHRELFETLPLGNLRGAIVVAGVDSRGARQRIAQACWRVGSRFIDTAVDGPELLCRVTTYAPSDTSPCAECSWEESSYRLLEQTLPCQEDAPHET